MIMRKGRKKIKKIKIRTDNVKDNENQNEELKIEFFWIQLKLMYIVIPKILTI